jgi:hypothetical protein
MFFVPLALSLASAEATVLRQEPLLLFGSGKARTGGGASRMVSRLPSDAGLRRNLAGLLARDLKD